MKLAVLHSLPFCYIILFEYTKQTLNCSEVQTLMTKRLITVGLSALLLLTLFSGCGKGAKNAPEPTPSSSLTASAAPADTRPVIGLRREF